MEMVKRIDKQVDNEVDKLNEKDAKAILTHARNSLTSGKTRSNESNYSDELIVSLADAYENKRARQVNEWEKGQRVAKAF
jgi:hypothetical protein